MNAKDISVSRDAVADPELRTANATRRQLAARRPGRTQSLARRPASTRAAGRSTPHESARAQVAGASTYVDDIPEVRGTLHAAPILSTVAHGRLLGVDTAAADGHAGRARRDPARATSQATRCSAIFSHDEPVFAQDTVQHIGQVIGVVVADTVMQARRAARKVVLTSSPLPALLKVRDALGAESYVLPPVFVKRGDAAAALAQARAQIARHARSRRPGTLLPRRPGRATSCRQEQRAVAGLFQHPAPRRDPALGVACAGHCQPRGARRMPAHGRRLRRQGNPVGPDGRLGRDCRPQAALPPSSCGWTATTTSWSPASATRSPTNTTWALTPPAASPASSCMMAVNCGFSADLSGAGGRPRGLPRRQRLLPRRRRDRLLPLQDQHPEPTPPSAASAGRRA